MVAFGSGLYLLFAELSQCAKVQILVPLGMSIGFCSK